MLRHLINWLLCLTKHCKIHVFGLREQTELNEPTAALKHTEPGCSVSSHSHLVVQ